MLRRAVSLINYDPDHNQITCISCFICATISKDLQSHMMMDTILITSLPPALNLDSKLQSRGNILRILELIIKIESRHIIGNYCICNVYSHHLLLHQTDQARPLLNSCKSNALLLMRFFAYKYLMEVVQRGASAKDTICWVGSSAAAAKEKNNPKVVVVTYVSKGTA